MELFNSINKKIINWSQTSAKKIHINGIDIHHWIYIFCQILDNQINNSTNENYFFICKDQDEAEDIFEFLKNNYQGTCNLMFYPGLECSPYSGIFPVELNLLKRFNVLSQIAFQKSGNLVVCTHESIMLLQPEKDLFLSNSFSFTVEDILSPDLLAQKLVDIGYSHNITVEQPGTFSKKGEVFDIFPIAGPPIRLNYYDELIESIKEINLNTNKTKQTFITTKISISPAPGIFLRPEYVRNLREKTPIPPTNLKNKFITRKNIFNSLSQNLLFENYTLFAPLFTKKQQTILEYIEVPSTLVLFEEQQISLNSINLIEKLKIDFEQYSNDSNGLNLFPSLKHIYKYNFESEINSFKSIVVSKLNIYNDLSESITSTINFNIESTSNFILRHVGKKSNRYEQITQIFNFICEFFQHSGSILFVLSSDVAKKEIQYLLEQQNISSSLSRRISYSKGKLKDGFFHPTDNLLILSEADLFAYKSKKTKQQTNAKVDLFAEQLSTLQKGDFIVHSVHGIGRYFGLESMDIGSSKTDYIIIEYDQGDKIYVPVYKMNLIQKHSSASAQTKINNLRSKKFQQIKNSAKVAIKKLAFDLLKLQAERESSNAFVFSPPDHLFKEFELSFPFKETSDQKTAIERVLNDMQRAKPMDHLVCGDVGFGKTEVAMRASFMAVNNNKQVAILVPTTILALQHYNSFTERFKNFAVNIDFLTRFKSSAESKEVKEKIKLGSIDIVIGTHKLLAKDMAFKNLGLVVVDEEQRFGVGHKEKLKLLKSSVDFLTLTATPIPRTMQLAFLGLKDLSLIQTAPPKRQSIKTYLINNDDYTIKNAIELELKRGGQLFYVHNRVKDIEIVLQYILKLVPHAKVVVAHGQMTEKELETRIRDFYSGKYQILLSTTIIESGLDIPNANTIIINRADTFGLSQLHQLRGRIGRSDKKAYAYFIIPKTQNINKIAQQRLKALQTYAEMGSGFSIASSDLEIRGAGDILGASQSGHIEAIGLELYMELLKEAINELKGEKLVVETDIELSTPFTSFIPNHYIQDQSERLKNYKKLSNCRDISQLEQLQEELFDIFGTFPTEVENLFTLIETRINLTGCGVKSLAVTGSVIVLNFDKKVLEKKTQLRNKIVETFMARPKIYKLTPNYQAIYQHKSKITQDILLKYSKNIAQQIVTC